jgi:riboflavin synthase
MFTGIVQEVGRIERIEPLGGGIRITVGATETAPKLRVNDSVAINGVCQTVVAVASNSFTVVAVEETLKKTTFASLRDGARVNLELPLRLNDLLGGHLMLGHVDTVGTVRKIDRQKTGADYLFELPSAFLKYVVYTGSVAIDGVSLTVAEVMGDSIRVAIIPHTMEKTIFSDYMPLAKVNIEVDVLGKYVEKLLSSNAETANAHNKVQLSIDNLKSLGY